MGQCRGAAGGSLKWLPRSLLKLPSLFFCCLDFATSHRILLTVKTYCSVPKQDQVYVEAIDLGFVICFQ